MCRRVSCPKCGKPDWAGCGAHIEAVLGDVPKSERCHCRDDEAAGKKGTASTGPFSALSSLFGGKPTR